MRIVFICLLLLCSCKKVAIVSNTTDEVNITGYLQLHPDKFSSFLKIISITGDEGFLGVYGAYTAFVPDNDAISAYLQLKGKGAVENIDVQELKDLVKFHLLEDTISTSSFSDGKLNRLTMYGQYLITGASNKDGVTRITVNRQANIIESNIRVGNGIIHVIDHVLQPAVYTLAAMIENDPRYSIFSQAVKETGLYDTLNILPVANTDSSRAWLTVLAESDSVLKNAGFNSYADLKARFSYTGDPKNPDDSLHLYVDYHILYGVKYLADIVSSTSHNTLAPLEVVTSKLSGQTVLINDDTFNGIYEPGVELNRAGSDNAASNGVLHAAMGHFSIKIRNPVPVYWDVANFPEIRNLPAYFGKQNYPFALTNMPKDITVAGPSAMQYTVGSTYVNGDFLQIPLGGPNRSAWVELRTPLLVRGKYKVWICYRTQKQSGSSNNVNQISVDGEPLQRTMNFTTSMPVSSEGEMEAQGWKWFTDPVSNGWAGRQVGTIEIKTTDRHLIRFTTLQGTQNTNNLDMIHFIPQDMDQLYPRFKTDGTPVPRP
ncbi:fasciclin domain-containing protein [Chitinophaga oryziterrae]|uniref:Fasciclin domain-containing protein n=1 Tax=Chitinophaga oryziterrae TaxID=1031224 RepID=A0A6N8J9E8_9BACT|nr:fasciclin domain-containing protein [Chitinophaga oryziterrae]MVT40722.1 fasciclin domain-containing protein [Chitinophaga oryziterrae]